MRDLFALLATGLWVLLLAMGPAFAEEHAPQRSILVHCGSSMRPAAEEIAKEFEQKYNIKVIFNFGGSETLLPQILLRKEGDIFICHDPFGDMVKKKKLLADSATVGYLAPVIITPKGNPNKIAKLTDLLQPGLRIGVTDPRYATCGEMVEKKLRDKKLLKSFNDHPNFVLQTRGHADVASALITEHIDAGIVWNFIGMDFKEKVACVPTHEQFPETRVTVVVLKCAKERTAAKDFMKLADSKFGRKVFADHGYSKDPK